jgi:hypothetical protein
METEFLDVWNVSEMKNSVVKLCNRTSNGLERYNYHMGRNVFSYRHPSLPNFVGGLKEETDRVILRIESVRKKHESPGKYQGGEVFPEIPEEYNSFRNPSASPKRKKNTKAAQEEGNQEELSAVFFW